ncbi:hypothetical protein C8A00DRAFT_37943 [Chaetomidium leptoderma]|uniref:Uncharacterized protein n=1 Tax=Chaetomidium leptoderma TaxID=669021 RepID=A0AAN6VDM9_9PEZI|nr:hypothetical protein C8A00DRAFT_37943 [Chaetomidium leptoderma]
MTGPEARDLLLKSVPKHLVHPSAANTLMAHDLVEELGCLPLAIAQAAANIVDQQMSFAENVGLFRREKRRRAELMASPAYDFANKDVRNGISSVTITWRISIDALKEQSPLSVTFLQYLACFHWRETPQMLLRRLPEFQNLDDASFLQLSKKPLALSLIDQTLDQSPQLSSYSVHPVLHEIMTAELSVEDKRHGMLVLESRAAITSIDTKVHNEEKVLLLSFLSVALRGKHDYGRLEEIHKEQLRCQEAEQWAAEDVLHRHNLAYGLLRNGKHAEAKELNDELLRYCETEDGIRVVGKKLHLIMLILKLLIMRMGKDVWQDLDEIVALYDRVFCENLSNFGIHDRETWIALNNRLGSLSQALRMDEVGDVLWSILPFAIAANVKADGRVAISMWEIHQIATNYSSYLSEGNVNGPAENPRARVAEFAQLLERWSYVSGIEEAIKTVCIGTPLSNLNALNTQGVHLQHQGRYGEAEAIHRRIISELNGAALDNGLSQLSHYNLMLAIARAGGRKDEAFTFRQEHQDLIRPMEATYGTLEQRQEEHEKGDEGLRRSERAHRGEGDPESERSVVAR